MPKINLNKTYLSSISAVCKNNKVRKLNATLLMNISLSNKQK